MRFLTPYTVIQPTAINLFSNILDIGEIDLKEVANLLAVTGYTQYVLCVGPVNYSHSRLDAFCRYFNVTQPYFSDYVNSQHGLLSSHRPYSCVCKGFKITRTKGSSVLVPLAYYPPKQFFAGYTLDLMREWEDGRYDSSAFLDATERHGLKEKLQGLLRFEVLAPFDLGASIYDDVNPMLAVLNNMVTRGLPTKASPFLEEELNNIFLYARKETRNGGFCYSFANDLESVGSSPLGESVGKTEQRPPCLHPLAFGEILLLLPIAVARIEKVILEALMTGRLELKKSWKVVVVERDVPCSALAFRDLQLLFDHLCALSQDYGEMRSPKVDLTIISSNEWANQLSLGQPVYEIIDDRIANAEYDMAIDFSIESETDPEHVKFSKFKNVRNNCYFNVRSSKKVYEHRRIYTSDRIAYKPLCSRNDQGRYVPDEEAVQHLRYFLQLLFRKEDFRPGQLPILSQALQNRSVIGLLPTGGGKSLTYQLAAMLQPGVTIVIDPLVSLMKDQYDGLKKVGVDCCTFINSEITAEEKKRNEALMESSQELIVFLSPERLCIYRFRERLANMHATHIYFSYGVIDEVHCVSEWGHDFRTPYLHLGRNLYNYVHPKEGHVSLFGLTATASFDVLADVERELSGNGAFPLDDDAIVRYENTNRLELQYYVKSIEVHGNAGNFDVYRAKNQAVPATLREMPSMLRELQQPDNIKRIKDRFVARENIQDEETIRRIQGKDLDVAVADDWYSGSDYFSAGAIVFCPHKSGSLGVYNGNRDLGVSATLCNELTDNVSTFVGGAALTQQDAFLNNHSPIMVATKAFGMGIDKPNVRFTINMNYSSSLESFVQEAGRAGRDQRMALAVILYNERWDHEVQEYFYDNSFRGADHEKIMMYSILDLQVMKASLEDTTEVSDPNNNTVNGFLRSLQNAHEGESLVSYVSYGYPSANTCRINQLLQRNGIDDFEKPVNDIYESIRWQVLNRHRNPTEVERQYALSLEKARRQVQENYAQAISKAIYRMCCIGLIEDFTQDYGTKTFRIVTTRHAVDYYKGCLQQFLERYYTPERAALEVAKVDDYQGRNEIDKCLGYLTEFVYEKVAAKRKRAIDDIESFCYNAVHSDKGWLEVNEDLKDTIYYYFNSKYAREDYVSEAGEAFSLTKDTDYGKVSSYDIVNKYMRVVDDDVIGSSGSPIDNVKHLQGAVRLIRRSLTDSNPALDFLNVFCLLYLKVGNNKNLQKDLMQSYMRGYREQRSRTKDLKLFHCQMQSFEDRLLKSSAVNEKELEEIETLELQMETNIHKERLQSFKKHYLEL